jgi:hypothetical protein
MAEIFQLQGKDAVVHIGIYPAINSMQNFNWDPRFNEEYISQLGDPNYAAQTVTPEITGSFELVAVGSTVAILRSMIVKKTAGEFVGFLRGDPAAADPNTGTIRETDLENAIFDPIDAKRPNQTFSRSEVLPRMHLSSIAIRADANGRASETYNFEGDLVRIMPTGKHDAFAVPATRVTASTTNMSLLYTTFDSIEISGGTEDYVIDFAMIDEKVVPTTNITVGASGTGLFSFTAPYEAQLGARVMVYLHKRTPGSFPSIEYTTDARFVKANQINIWLVSSSTVDIAAMADGDLMAYDFDTDDQVFRVQSVDMNIDLRREALRQIALTDTGNSVYYRAATYPLNITASLNVLETDMAFHAKLEELDDTTDILDLAGFEGKEWQIVIRYYLEGTAIQTTAFTNARVSGRGTRVQAAGRAEINWSFTGSGVMIDGVSP